MFSPNHETGSAAATPATPPLPMTEAFVSIPSVQPVQPVQTFETDTPAHTGFLEYMFQVCPRLQKDTGEGIRYVPPCRRLESEWKSAGERIACMMEGGLLTLPTEYHPTFGNPFVYFMKYFACAIAESIDLMLYQNMELTASKMLLTEMSRYDRGYDEGYARAIAATGDAVVSLRREEMKLQETLRSLHRFVRTFRVEREAKRFFSYFTASYYGESFKLDGLYWWFDIEERL